MQYAHTVNYAYNRVKLLKDFIIIDIKTIDFNLEVTQTHSTGVKDLHREPYGAGSVGKQSIAMTTTAPGAVALKIRCKLT